MSAYRFRRPPRVLRKAKLDNLALVPASLLPLKKHWQAIANDLPKGATLIILPERDNKQRRNCKKVAAHLRKKGREVKLLTNTTLAQQLQQR